MSGRSNDVSLACLFQHKILTKCLPATKEMLKVCRFSINKFFSLLYSFITQFVIDMQCSDLQNVIIITSHYIHTVVWYVCACHISSQLIHCATFNSSLSFNTYVIWSIYMQYNVQYISLVSLRARPLRRLRVWSNDQYSLVIQYL